MWADKCTDHKGERATEPKNTNLDAFPYPQDHIGKQWGSSASETTPTAWGRMWLGAD